MGDLLTTADVAARLGTSRSAVCRAAKKCGLGVSLGRGKPTVFSAADLPRLREAIPGRVGNPSFTPGNYFGRKLK